MATKSNIRDVKRQVSTIQRNAKKVIRGTIPRKVEQALTGVGVVVANKALEYTPLEYSLLQNSQYRIVEATEKGYQAKVGYTMNYAAALHNRTDWKPRPPNMKAGPAWNPNAKPRFLYLAAEEEQVTINRIMLGDLEL